MEDLIMTRINDLAKEINGLLAERDELINYLKSLDEKIVGKKEAIFELKKILDENRPKVEN